MSGIFVCFLTIWCLLSNTCLSIPWQIGIEDTAIKATSVCPSFSASLGTPNVPCFVIFSIWWGLGQVRQMPLTRITILVCFPFKNNSTRAHCFDVVWHWNLHRDFRTVLFPSRHFIAWWGCRLDSVVPWSTRTTSDTFLFGYHPWTLYWDYSSCLYFLMLCLPLT